MNNNELAEAVVNKMYDNDAFSQWMGIERVETMKGRSVLRMLVKKEMLNGFDIIHGGVTFSLADSALAFAANSHGKQSLVVEASMSFTKPAREGDTLTAIAREIHLSNKIGLYNIQITNQDEELIAIFKGTVYRTSKDWNV